nr:NADH dehydrogenase subunit 6 [Cerodontha fulvipes]
MMQSFIWMMMMILTMMMMQMTHPLSMGLMLLMHTIMMSMMTGIMAKSFWYSYILFLIFLGGMLVLFIYVASLASNEMFSMSIKTLMISLFMTFMSILFILMLDNSMFNLMFQNSDMEIMNLMNYSEQQNYLSLMKLYNLPTNYINIMMMNYLLITMIASVKITNIFYGPLRVS